MNKTTLRTPTLCTLLFSVACGGIRYTENDKGLKISNGSTTITLSDRETKDSSALDTLSFEQPTGNAIKYYRGYGDIRNNLDWYAKILSHMPRTVGTPIDEYRMRKMLDEWTYIPPDINEKNAHEFNRRIVVGRSYDYAGFVDPVLGERKMFILHITYQVGNFKDTIPVEFCPTKEQFALLEARKELLPSNDIK